MSLVASRSVDLCECKNHIIQYLRHKHRDMFKTDWHHYMDITTEIEPNYTLPIIKTCLSQLKLSGQIESNNCGEFRLISRSSVWLDHQKCTNIVDEKDITELIRLEANIRASFQTKGAAFKQVRDRRLYKIYCSRFDEYCELRFGISESSVNEFIQASDVFNNILNQLPINGSEKSHRIFGDFVVNNVSVVIPRNKSHLLPIAKLPTEQHRAAWMKICQTSQGRPNSAIAKKVVEDMLGGEKESKIRLDQKIITDKSNQNPEDENCLSSKGEVENTQCETFGNTILRKIKPSKKINADIVQKDGPIYVSGELLTWHIVLNSEENFRKVEQLKERLGTITLEGAIMLAIDTVLAKSTTHHRR